MKTAKPTVKILQFTNWAIEILIYTKSGRLGQDVTLADVINWPQEKKIAHLEYMMDTIKSSFEFVDYVFEINNVSRNFTHQLVRTRTASFQQESQRTVDVRDNSLNKNITHPLYVMAIDNSLEVYESLIDMGYPVQDCRDVLPTGMHTKIFIKANLRTLSQMAELRLCKRTAGEYQEVFKMMKNEVMKIHPYFSSLMEVYCVKTGMCYFPRYKNCPVQKYTLNKMADSVRKEIKSAWATSNHIANPKAKDGRTM